MIRRLNALPMRSRLALLAALTVALAVTACAAACWFLVRAQLMGTLDDSLRNTRMEPSEVVGRVQSGQCTPPDEKAPNPFGATVQVVDRQGTSCVIVGNRIDVTSADVSVAEGHRRGAVHDAVGAEGTDYRVVTTPVPNTNVALSVARPLTELEDSLRNLALILALVATAGVLAAAGAGVALARAGLRPVDRLTEAAEHIARTEDLAVRIPVEGDDEIARLSKSFNSMTGALASSRELQQQLIADAGHELRTPLTSLRTNIDLLVRSEETGRQLPPDDRKALLDSVRAQMAELGALIGDLQELSRPDATPGSGRVTVVALHELASRAVERVRLRSSGVTVTSDLAPWYVRGEAAALERAVVNLIDNAVKFSPADSVVEVSLGGGATSGAEETDEEAQGVLRVRDHGPGVQRDELPYVFDRFWRSPSARSLPGSGLGLSIVARTVQQTGGTVELLQADGGGTDAVVRLPGAPVPPPDVPEVADGDATGSGDGGPDEPGSGGGTGGGTGGDEKSPPGV